ncbi:hypothetical protein F0Q53_00745 [Anaplasma marginale]|uniref:Uncharacterized protein n=1 Tax=Anaplasma marginale TaxID=770 RepID=A0A643CMJ2_ANAMA|nr:hypothetical protein CQZ76_01425 [Anaplasma marginale]KAA8473076.1 hypothetical protein F0Q58_00215 [Anaplasma marginale]KAA8475317.1 hypothetical protein F0Q53_00745 [Anaplasma marginale]KAB0451435.1 hypothetical protein FY210_00215 [Anaplasma marginale]KAB0452890.1 hypothetical protein FY207_00745 [Anaplasma marginale]
MVWACNVAALGPLRIVVRCSKMRAKAASRQLRLAFGGIYCAPCTDYPRLSAKSRYVLCWWMEYVDA